MEGTGIIGKRDISTCAEVKIKECSKLNPLTMTVLPDGENLPVVPYFEKTRWTMLKSDFADVMWTLRILAIFCYVAAIDSGNF